MMLITKKKNKNYLILAECRCLTDLPPARLVSVLRLRNLRCQLPIGLVRRLFHRRTIPHDSVPTQTPGAVSSVSCQSRRLQLCRSRPCSVQLRHLDIRRYAALRTLLRQTVLSGTSTWFFVMSFHHLYALFATCSARCWRHEANFSSASFSPLFAVWPIDSYLIIL